MIDVLRLKVNANCVSFVCGILGIAFVLAACESRTDEELHFLISVRYTFDGLEYSHKGAFHCAKVTGQSGLFGKPRSFNWQPYSFSNSLASGAGLIVVPYPVCGLINRGGPAEDWDKLDVADYLSRKDVVRIYWIDDPRNPKVIEGYLQPEYFQHKDARVRNVRVSIEQVETAPRDLDVVHEDWDFGGDPDQVWEATSVRIYPESVWRRSIEFVGWASTLGVGFHSVPAGLEQALWRDVGRLDEKGYIVPQIRSEGRVDILYRNEAPLGWVRFVPKRSVEEVRRYLNEKSVYSKYFDGREIPPEDRSRLVYDSSTRLIFGLGRGFRLNPSVWLEKEE